MKHLSNGPFGHPAFMPCKNFPQELLGNFSSYDHLKKAVANYLIGLAVSGGKCTYRELLSTLCIPFNLSLAHHRKLMGEVFGEINGEQYAQKRPLIAVLVCSESDGYITGAGFYNLMSYAEFSDGFTFNKEIDSHRAAFFGLQSRRCWKYWSQKKKYNDRKAA